MNKGSSFLGYVILKEISKNIHYGYTATSSIDNIGPKFLRITDIQNGKVNWNEVPFCQISLQESEKYLLKEKDIVFARTGATVGKSFLIKGKIPESVFASYLIRLQLSDKALPEFVYYFFQSSDYWKQIRSSSSGIGQPNVNAQKLSNLLIPLPPLPEQKKIVAKIEELFSELDKGIEQLKNAKEQLRVYRQSVLSNAFSGRLFQRSNGPIAKYEMLNSAEPKIKYCLNQDSSDSMITTNKEEKSGKSSDSANLGQDNLPVGWIWESLQQITTRVGDGLHGTPKYSVDGEFYFINGNNLSNGKIEIKPETKRVSVEEYSKYKKELNEQTIFVSINGTLGRTAFYNKEKVILGKSACYFNLNKNYDKKYVRYYLTTQHFFDYTNKTATGSTIKNVPLKAMREFEIPIPPTLLEQTQIVAEIESRFSVADKLEKAIEENLKKSEGLRQSILKKAFEGRLIQ